MKKLLFLVLILALLLSGYGTKTLATTTHSVYLPLLMDSGHYHVFATGDSKSIGFLSYLLADMKTGTWVISSAPHSGATTAMFSTYVTTDIEDIGSPPNYILINLGANDVPFEIMDEQIIKTDYAYSLDAYHAAWPDAWIGVMQIWRRGYETNCDLYNSWLAKIVSTRPWAHLGPDERIFLENGDDGVTYTRDGIHPNDAGWALTAKEWENILDLTKRK